MREIEFRGKRISDNKLVYGQLRCAYGKDLGRVFIYNEFGLFEVIPESVGQFIGLLDKKGNNIFEGDVVNINEAERNYVVKFHNGCFKLFHADPKLNGMLWGNVERVSELLWNLEIIGNVLNNPELLK